MTEQSEDLEQEVEPTEDPSAESTEELEAAAETEGEPQRQSRSQNAKQRLRRKLRDEQAMNARLAEENRQLTERFNALEQKLDPVINPPPPRPSRDDFESEEAYEDALLDWRDASKTPSPAGAPQGQMAGQYGQQPAPQEPVDPVTPEVRKNWESQIDSASDKYDDFDDAIISIPREAMTDTMTYTIMESEQGGEVAYFLGKNHAEADRIAGLSPASQVREIDKLAARFVKKSTRAPDPVTPLNSGGDAGGKDPDKMSPEEYRRWRHSQRPAHY